MSEQYPKEMLVLVFMSIITVLQLGGFLAISLLLNYAESRQRYLKPSAFVGVLLLLAASVAGAAQIIGAMLYGW